MDNETVIASGNLIGPDRMLRVRQIGGFLDIHLTQSNGRDSWPAHSVLLSRAEAEQLLDAVTAYVAWWDGNFAANLPPDHPNHPSRKETR